MVRRSGLIPLQTSGIRSVYTRPLNSELARQAQDVKNLKLDVIAERKLVQFTKSAAALGASDKYQHNIDEQRRQLTRMRQAGGEGRYYARMIPRILFWYPGLRGLRNLLMRSEAK